MEIHGITGKPYAHPRVLRKIPVHNRPRIDLDGGSQVKRSWQDVSVLDIKAGDTVSDFGTVESTVEFVNIPELGSDEEHVFRVRLYNIMGGWQDYTGEQRVFAFAPERESPTG